MEVKKIKTKKILGVFVALALFCLVPIAFAGNLTYTPLEQIPGQASVPTDFYTYISYVYRFGIGAVGIAALLMLVIGGFMYITSAGNNASMEKAKGVITDAIVGVILALTAYLLLYTINPELIQIKRLPAVQAPTAGTIQLPTTPPGVLPTTKVNFQAPRMCNNGECNAVQSAIQANSFGVDPAILKSLIVGGESCNPNTSPAGACGYTQLMPANRSWCGISGTAAETCAAVKNDVQLAVNCASNLLKNDMMKRCGPDMTTLASCYNTGSVTKGCGENNYCVRAGDYYANKCGA